MNLTTFKHKNFVETKKAPLASPKDWRKSEKILGVPTDKSKAYAAEREPERVFTSWTKYSILYPSAANEIKVFAYEADKIKEIDDSVSVRVWQDSSLHHFGVHVNEHNFSEGHPGTIYPILKH